MDDFIADRPAYGSLSAAPPPVTVPKRAGFMWSWIVTLAAVAFASGLLLSPWFTAEVRGRLFGAKSTQTTAAATASVTHARALAALQARITALEQSPGKAGGDPARIVRTEAQVNELQSQVGALGVRVEGAVTGAAQDAQTAQSVMLAAATRRAIETGQVLGPLEPPLRARFGQSYPGPVEAIAAVGSRPVTLTQLQQDFARIATSRAVDIPATPGWWASFKSAMADIVSLRRTGEAQINPAAQMALAAQRLEAGDVTGTINSLARLPSNRAVAAWLIDARRYRAAQAAIAQIEAAALAPTAQPAVIGTPVTTEIRK